MENNEIGLDLFNAEITGDVSMTLTGNRIGAQNIPCTIGKAFEIGNGQTAQTEIRDVCGTLDCMHDQKAVLVKQGGAMDKSSRDNEPPIVKQTVVRRLTPKECERLQGFPDEWTNIGDWTDSKGRTRHSADGLRYKALGNSIALPFWEWLAERIVEQLKKDGTDEPTMASLFDGIGGFPLVFQRNGCFPVWASEIEDFPIAVTKKHFPEDEKQQRKAD